MTENSDEQGPGMVSPPLIDFDTLRATQNGNRKRIGGSEFDCFNDLILSQIAFAPYFHELDDDLKQRLANGALAGIVGQDPQDEIEAMLIAQIISTHCMVMECNRRAMITDQYFDARISYMKQGAKLASTTAQLVTALNKHRGKGQQKVTVEHVHVHEGGQAIVGNVEQGGEQKRKGQGHAKQVAHAPEPEVRSALKTNGETVPAAGNGKRAL